MKPAAFLLALLVATGAFAGEKKPDARSFRMPAKSGKPKVATTPKPVVETTGVEVVKPAPPAPPVVRETQPAPPVPAFRFPNAPKPEPVAVETPAAPAVTPTPAATSPRSFTLPGEKPVSPKKKNPTTFRMPAKKSE